MLDTNIIISALISKKSTIVKKGAFSKNLEKARNIMEKIDNIWTIFSEMQSSWAEAETGDNSGQGDGYHEYRGKAGEGGVIKEDITCLVLYK